MHSYVPILAHKVKLDGMKERIDVKYPLEMGVHQDEPQHIY